MTRGFRSLLAIAAVALVSLVSAAQALAAAPVSTSPPTIEGRLYAGQTIRAGTGFWNNNPTSFTYQWLRCDEKGTNCAKIAKATAAGYTLTKDDVGHTIIVLVTASNDDGTTGPVNSKPSKVVSAAVAPESTTAPTLTGRAIVGQLLLVTPPKYSGGLPAATTYRWQRCSAGGGSCSTISGESRQTYTVRGVDEGNTLRAVVRATNPYGTDTSTSAPTAIVTKETIVAVTTSMVASRSVVTCCQTTTLSGTISTGKANEPVTILAREFDLDALVIVGTTRTTAGGEWSFKVRPSIETLYQAKTSNATSPAVTVKVHPRVGLGFQRGIFSTKVTGGSDATSFAGKVVLFQRRASSGRWATIQRVVLDLRSIARFTKRLPRGESFVRVYLPRDQAGAGYLDGVSKTRRFTRR